MGFMEFVGNSKTGCIAAITGVTGTLGEDKCHLFSLEELLEQSIGARPICHLPYLMLILDWMVERMRIAVNKFAWMSHSSKHRLGNFRSGGKLPEAWIFF